METSFCHAKFTNVCQKEISPIIACWSFRQGEEELMICRTMRSQMHEVVAQAEIEFPAFTSR